MERAKDEPEMRDYSMFHLISSFTMGLSFRRSKEVREMGKKRTKQEEETMHQTKKRGEQIATDTEEKKDAGK